MSEKVKKIRVKQADGTMSDYIPLGADAEYIDINNGNSAEYKITNLSSQIDDILMRYENIN